MSIGQIPVGRKRLAKARSNGKNQLFLPPRGAGESAATPNKIKWAWLSGDTYAEQKQIVLIYGLTILLLATTFAISPAGSKFIRLAFIAGAIGLSWRAWRVGPGLHVEVVIALFVFTPMLRRTVDLYAGYDASGYMLLGPLFSLALPVSVIPRLLGRYQRNPSDYMPYALMFACLCYGWSVSALQGFYVEGTADVLKSAIPMCYAIYLILSPKESEAIIESAARVLMLISPLIGVYGVIQYLNPPEWDRYWMVYSKMTSIGLPEARQVRVFSTMNSPASFAMFAACSILVFSFCRRGIMPFILVFPILMALLLSSVRTAWIVILFTTLFCTLFDVTRGRSILLSLCLAGLSFIVLILTPFGDMIGDRLATFGGDPAQDGSGHARLQEYFYIYSNLDRYLFGIGLGAPQVDKGLSNIDGQLVGSAVSMGIFVGNIYVIGMIWAALGSIFRISSLMKPLPIVIAGLVISYVMVLPLISVSAGEISFLFWMFVGILSSFRKSGLPIPAVREQIRHVAYSKGHL